MRAIDHKIQLSTAILLVVVLGSYLYSTSAHGAEARDISRINGSISIEPEDQVGDVSTVNGGIRVERRANARTVSTVNGGIELQDEVVVDEAETVNGSIRVGQEVQINGSLQSVNGGIRTGAGTVVEDGVQTVNGRVRLYNTQVHQDVQTSSGDIDIRDGSSVEGDVIVRGRMGWWNRLFHSSRRSPELTIDESSVVKGDIHLYQEVDLNIADGSVEGEIIEHF